MDWSKCYSYMAKRFWRFNLMATTTPNFGWPVPTSTDLVKDGATAIEALGDSIDASLLDLKGGTTGQVLSKNSNTDMDFTWVTDPGGDITNVSVTSPITGGGSSGSVTIGYDTKAGTTLALNAQTGTTYTLVAADASNKLVELNNASAITLTVPPSVFSIGEQINVYQRGAGQVSFAQGAGVTIRSTGATSTAPKLRAQYSAATVICIGVSEFLIVGDLS
jgi:hypothetical protein